MVHLGPLEVLSALQHAELRLGRQFTRDEFIKGEVGKHMVPEDFDHEVTVSKNMVSHYSPAVRPHR